MATDNCVIAANFYLAVEFRIIAKNQDQMLFNIARVKFMTCHSHI